jgi:hypothetical protein
MLGALKRDLVLAALLASSLLRVLNINVTWSPGKPHTLRIGLFVDPTQDLPHGIV